MTIDISTIGKFVLPAAAVAASVFGMAASSTAHTSEDHAPLACEFATHDSAFGTTFEGNIRANEPIEGSYQMTFTKNGSNSATINQSGTFDLDTDETVTLGQASFGGNASVDAEMTLEVNGQTLICRTGGPIDL